MSQAAFRHAFLIDALHNIAASTISRQELRKYCGVFPKGQRVIRIITAIKKDEPVIELAVPIVTGTDTIGKVVIGMSKRRIEQQY